MQTAILKHMEARHYGPFDVEVGVDRKELLFSPYCKSFPELAVIDRLHQLVDVRRVGVDALMRPSAIKVSCEGTKPIYVG